MAGPIQALFNRDFKIDGKLLDGQQAATLSLRFPDGDRVAQAIQSGAAFPPGDVSIGSIRLAASTGNQIPFHAAGAVDKVNFTANAKGFFEAGVYSSLAKLRADLAGKPDVAGWIDLDPAAGRLCMICCGYDVGATAKGSLALGTGASVNFGGSASRDGLYAVVHQFADGEPAASVIDETIKGWILPNQFDGGEFPARTAVVVEVDGSVALNLGAQAGYDYSWLRQFPGGALKGDLGLKVQLAANVALGFSANGSFAMVLERPDDANVVRLRLFKLAKNGWNFAFHASAGEQLTLPPIFGQGKNIADLIAAVFGVHIAQLVEDLTDPRLSTASGAANFIVQRGLKEIPGEADVENLFAAGKAKVDEFLSQWKTLTHKPATMLASILQKNHDVAAFTDFLKTLTAARDAAGVKQALAGALARPDFFQTSIGQWIESVVPTTSLAALAGDMDWRIVQSLSATALQVIDGQTLSSLIDFATSKLGLDGIAAAIKKNEPASLDAWLESKIADFLGKDATAQLVLGDLQKAQAALQALEGNAGKFYDLARQAAQKKYEIAFTSTYQKSTSSTAALDATFDLTAGPAAADALRSAIGGDFQKLLLEPIPGVTLAAATLTHDINRQSHSDLTLPFIDLSSDDASDSLASVSPVEDNGRVLVYNLKAQDETRTHTGFFHASAQSNSKLSLVASLPVSVTGAVRRFSDPSVSCGYTLTRAAKAITAGQLQHDAQPLVDAYMPALFGSGKPPFADWVGAVDRQVDSARTGVLGEATFTFDVALPGDAFDPWFATSTDRKDPQYFAMSTATQRFLRRVLPFYYFADAGKYDAGPLSDNVLAYGALPPLNGFKITGDGNVGTGNGDLYFGVDAENLTAILETIDFANAIRRAMLAARDILFPIDRGASDQYFPNDRNIARVTTHALQAATLPGILASLLLFENDLINAVAKAGVQMAQFRGQAATEPAAAVKALSSFGDTFVETFNHRLGGNIVGGSYLRSLGSALLLEIAQGLSAATPPPQTRALFRLSILDGGAPLEQLAAGDLGGAKVLLRETLVS